MIDGDELTEGTKREVNEMVVAFVLKALISVAPAKPDHIRGAITEMLGNLFLPKSGEVDDVHRRIQAEIEDRLDFIFGLPEPQSLDPGPKA
jgi:hypothetical protein